MDAKLELGLRRQVERFQDIRRGGWKVGLTSGASRDRMGVGFRPFGHIASEQIFQSDVQLSIANVGDIGVENELCFHFAEDVPRDVTRDRLSNYIEAVSPSFELNQQRLGENASNAERLADNLSQWGIVCGEPVANWHEINLDEIVVSLFRDGELISETPAHGHIDDHLDSLLALIGTLSQFNLAITRGDSVITGAFGRSRVSGPSVWRGDFGPGIGIVEVSWV